MVAKAGTLSTMGVDPDHVERFPIGQAMMPNLTVNMGNCNHREYIPELVELGASGSVDPTEVLTHHEPLTGVLDAYRAFDERQPGWIQVGLEPSA